ncbi:MAG TPA: response regulator transcription factor [Candidatus Acidoferrales bacterium]|jgi:DNA-binding NarL/FixJ family response regulator|nr:response regulator transcription factor [Candidatus Acidoferrales bacterium]
MLNTDINHQEEASAVPAEAKAPINIWLVDDNRNLRSTLMEILEKCDGLQCTATFHSPNAVLSALASKAGPDIILLDIQMGEACGLDAIRPIKALSRSTQVLMLTTFFDMDQKKKALTAGASGFLLKRFPIEEILDSIQKASKNPVPHLKRSRGQSREAGREQETAPCRPQRRRPWFKQALNLMHLRHN